MQDKYRPFKQLLDKKYEQNRFHQLKNFQTSASQASQINFQSYDSLSLGSHSYVKKNTIKYILEFGLGSNQSLNASRRQDLQGQVEARLQTLAGFEEAFFLSNTQNIHRCLMGVLTPAKSMIFIDDGCHHLLASAALESGAKTTFYGHNNLALLEEQLSKQSHLLGHVKLIVTESLFHHYGDLIYLQRLASLADKHGAILYIDDSSSFGVMGENGLGFCSHKRGIDLVVSSVGKTFSSYGSFICCAPILKEALLELSSDIASLRNLAPASIGAIDAILDILPDMDMERQKLGQNAQWARRALKEKGFDLGDSSSHIIPLFFASKEAAEDLHKHLMHEGLLTNFVDLEEKGALVKLIIHGMHTKQQIEKLLKITAEWERPLLYKTL